MEKLKNIPSLRFPEFDGEWKIKSLGEVANVSKLAGYEFTKHITYEESGSIIALRGLNIKNNELDLTDVKYIDNSELNKLERSKLYVDDLMFTYIGTIGQVALIKENNKFYLAPNVSRIRVNQNLILPKYILQFFNNDKFKNNEIAKYVSSSSQPALSMENVRKFEISFPAIQEQNKIASFLTAVDDKLQALKQKKTLLEQYKKGVMQKIFSQELRFKDDNENDYPDWEEKKLGKIFYSEKGKGISKNKVIPNGNFECVLYGELYTKYNEVIYNVVSTTNEVDGIKSKIGDLLIPSSTTTTGIDLANVTALNKDDVLLGGDITVLRSNTEINNVFYAYYLSNYKKEEIASYAQGSTIVHLYYSHIKDMEIHTLSFSEQTKIANFLSAIDDKINHCQVQVEKTEVWKKGLLQKMFC